MRIAVYHELPRGGARISVNDISKLLRKNHTVDLYTISNDLIGKSEKNHYSSVYFFKYKFIDWHGADWKRRLYKDTIELINLYRINKKISKIIDKRKYDVVFVNASSRIESPFILRFIKTRSFFYLHDPYFRLVYDKKLNEIGNVDIFRKTYENVFRFILKWLDKTNLQFADYVIANSFYTKKEFEKTYNRKSKIIKLGIDTRFFKYKKSNKRFDLLYIGSKNVLDGFDTLKKVKKHLKGLRIKEVYFEEGWKSKNEIRDLYYESKLVLSLSRNEPLGMVTLEASLCGTPSIAVEEGGYKETIINGVTGFLVKRKPKKIAEKVMEVLKNKDLISRISRNGSEYVREKWNIETTAQQLEKYFSEKKS